VRQEASPSLTGECIGYGSQAITRCGDVRVHHWAHKGRKRIKLVVQAKKSPADIKVLAGLSKGQSIKQLCYILSNPSELVSC